VQEQIMNRNNSQLVHNPEEEKPSKIEKLPDALEPEIVAENIDVEAESSEIFPIVANENQFSAIAL
jgi:hypothetical protein